MSPESKNIREERLEEGLGSLRGCLVEGDAEQRRGERRVRRRALAISILLQSAVLATLILLPLFGKAERISPSPSLLPLCHTDLQAIILEATQERQLPGGLFGI